MSKSVRVLVAACAFAGLVSQSAFAFEDSRVMPKGVRRLSVRFVNTNITQKTDGNGYGLELEKPLEKPLTFKDIIKGEKDPVKRQLTTGYLVSENFAQSDSVGDFKADITSKVNVYAPILTYGLTDAITLAAAMPIYDMQMSVASGFRTSDTGQRFLESLATPYNNQTASARDAGDKINNAVGRLNTKLTDNGYSALQDWRGRGIGDTQMLAKYRYLDTEYTKSAVTAGFLAPTGRLDDPDNLIDKGFGDGQWDIFGQVALDEPLLDTGITFNQSVKYTNQLPGKKTIRMVTRDETIEVPKQEVKFKLGDKIEAAVAAQIESEMGFGGGVGYNFYTKQKDIYKVPQATKEKLEDSTFERSHQAEFEIVYSGVPAFKRKEIPVPFETKLSYKRQLASRNMPITHFVQFDCGVFF